MAHLQPIKSRAPGSALLIHAALMIYTLFICSQRLFADQYPCWLSLLQGFFGLIIIGNLYIIRCILLYVQFYSIDPEYASTIRNKWFSKVIRSASDMRTLQISGILTSVVFLTPAFIFVFKNDFSYEYGDFCIRNAGRSASLIYFYAVLYFVIFFYLTLKLRTIFDGFRIKQELLYIEFSWIISITIWILFNYPNQTSDINNQFPISALFLFLGIFLEVLISIIWPIYLALHTFQKNIEKLNASDENLRRELDINPNEGQSSEDLFSRILNSQLGYSYFESFLIARYNAEALLLWKSLSDLLSQDYELQKIQSILYEISEMFLSLTAPLRVPDDFLSEDDICSFQHLLTMDSKDQTIAMLQEMKKKTFQYNFAKFYFDFLVSNEYQLLLQNIKRINVE
jgi:hypothetical protein